MSNAHSMADRRQQMADRLEDAFRKPRQKFCFYSANGAETGSERQFSK